MKPRGSYHTHSTYCDGDATIRDTIEAAVRAGLSEVGISSHLPLPFDTDWTMPPQRLASYIEEVQSLREEYRDRITVLLGGEIDYIPDRRVSDFQAEELVAGPFDYFVGSVHFLGRGYPPSTFDGTEDEFARLLRDQYADNMADMAEDYYGRVAHMLATPGVRIVGHVDLLERWNAAGRYFRGDEPWYRAAVEGALIAVVESGLLLELNTAGWRKGLRDCYPARWILERCAALGIPIIVNSDAHEPDQVAWGFERAERHLAELGIEPQVRLSTWLESR